MKAIHTLASVGVLAALVVGTLPAQEPPPTPERPRARARMHEPGTRLQEGQTPQRIRQGRGMRGLAGRRGGATMFAPRALIAQRGFLGLSDEQVAQFERLGEETRAAQEAAREQVQTHEEALREAWAADEPDVGVIRQHAEAAMQAKQQAELAAIEAAARAKVSLNAEQLGKVQGLMQGRRMSARRGAGIRGGTRSARMQRRPGAFRGRGFRRPAPRRP